MDLGYRVKKYKIHRIQLDTKHSFLVRKNKISSTYMYKIVKGEYVYSQILSVYHMLQYTNKRYKNLTIIFSAECTIGMVWGLTPLTHYGNKAIRN